MEDYKDMYPNPGGSPKPEFPDPAQTTVPDTADTAAEVPETSQVSEKKQTPEAASKPATEMPQMPEIPEIPENSQIPPPGIPKQEDVNSRGTPVQNPTGGGAPAQSVPPQGSYTGYPGYPNHPGVPPQGSYT
ncbi:MAG: hypothetical protein K2I93_03310, partial [Oscillospiraceae bacterium]|nr:hypothetical protein [Oscillospiraceae bacterium]